MTKVRLDTIEDVKAFVATTVRLPVDVTLKSGKYVVDGKSIMGIFSLNLVEPIALVIDTEDADKKNECLTALDKFIVK